MIIDNGDIPYTLFSSIRTYSSLGLVVAHLLNRIPLVHRILFGWAEDPLPLSSVSDSTDETGALQRKRLKEQFSPPKWCQASIAGLLLLQVLIWTFVFGDELALAFDGEVKFSSVLLTAGMTLVWLYLFLRTLLYPPTTPPWTALAIYCLSFLVSISVIAATIYSRYAFGAIPAWSTASRMIFESVNIVITLSLSLLIGTLRFNSPETLSLAPILGQDDTVSLASWITFSWLNPFIAWASVKEMEPEDLPTLSPTQQTAIVFENFRQMAGSTLLWKLYFSNRFDLIVDAGLTVVSVVFNYMSPYFLKKILDGISQGQYSSEAVAQAYVFAFLALAASVAKAIVDLIHLWHNRRATVRIKAGLTAAIYDKALRRKDASGIVGAKPVEEKQDDSKDDPKNASGNGKAKNDAAKTKKGAKSEKVEEEKKTNADSGKVVNLMAGDASRVSTTVSFLYFIYANPIELVVASLFLYNILGWTAFAGVIVLAIATPINSIVSKRAIGIQKELLAARDKRISVMTELINAISFIKFFAWTSRWKKRAADARKEEMRQMIRALLNNLIFSLVWSLVPVLVTLCSFFCYIVIAKRELTVSIAFTSISLFSMLRMPLNTIPTFIVAVLQAGVSVKRIDDFLAEDEVPDWVSSLKAPADAPSGPSRIAFEHATIRWNSGKKDTLPDASKVVIAGESTDSTIVDSATTASEADVFELSDLTVDFPLGKLTVVTGPTGAGKTAVLVGLLGEMDLIEGKSWLPKYTTQVDSSTGLRNSVAYCAQTAWLQQKSIKDNILFGEEYDEERYEAVVEACALVPDFDILEDGDQTEIGAKGVSLSGGQKARVALARAVYSYTQHVLLDDPLAAVDSHTAKHLTDKCLNGPLLKGRTVIIVSHHVELLLPSAHYLVRILDGRIDAHGTPDELRASGELEGLVALEEAEASKVEAITADEAVADDIEAAAEGDGEAVVKKEKKKGPGRKLVKDEERAVGNVKWATYKMYIEAATYITWALTLLVLVFAQVASLGERWWLKIWGEAYNTRLHSLFAFATSAIPDQTSHAYSSLPLSMLYHDVTTGGSNMTFSPGLVMQSPQVELLRLPSADAHPGFYLSGYAIIVLSTALLGVLSSAVGAWSSYRAATTLHDRLLETVLQSTIRFFNTTPVGRILNRFSKDVETIDTSLNGGLRTVMIYVASLFSAVVLVAVIIPGFLLPAAVISFLYYQYTDLYLRTGRSLRRLDATTRSPIFSGFAELLDGVVSVRAFSVEARFFKTLCSQVDLTNSAFYYYWMTNRWLLLRFDVLGALSVFLTTLLALSGAVSDGSAGVAIVSSQGFVQACYWVSRFWGQLEMDLNSVERVQEYLHVPQEPPAVNESNRPPAYWPSSAPNETFISVREVEIKYAPELPTVFKGSFDVRAGEKIGLIGRTGSGKSTLAMALLRFNDPAAGSIHIDGIDITSIGVDDLRSRITYIPQDAVLFSGTVRDNLDPFGEHTDDELIDALTRVKLITETPAPSRLPSRQPSHARLAAVAQEAALDMTSAKTDNGSLAPPSVAASITGSSAGPRVHITLATDVSAGGANFSQGQRQLVAMARALLRRSNLIIMDEATASVDFATDEALQSAIRSEFKESTLITIAHRLTSVIDYDRLLVLGDGTVAEFDTPINLLRHEGSIFKSLCEKTGKFRELYKAAERKEAGHGHSAIVNVSAA